MKYAVESKAIFFPIREKGKVVLSKNGKPQRARRMIVYIRFESPQGDTFHFTCTTRRGKNIHAEPVRNLIITDSRDGESMYMHEVIEYMTKLIGSEATIQVVQEVTGLFTEKKDG